MGRKRKRAGDNEAGSSGPAAAALSAIALAAAIGCALQAMRAPKAAAEAEWQSFQSLPKPRSEMVKLGEQAIEHLEACVIICALSLPIPERCIHAVYMCGVRSDVRWRHAGIRLDPTHAGCAFERAKALMHIGGPETRRALALFQSVDLLNPELYPVQAMETLWFTAAAAEKCGERGQQQAAYEQILAIANGSGSSKLGPRGFRGVPNAWSGIAGIRLAEGDLVGATEAVAAGIKAASKLRPKYITEGTQPQDEMSKRGHMILMSALPELYEIEGRITAQHAGVGTLQAVQAAKEAYYKTVTEIFPKWPRQDQATAALNFGLALASMRLATDPPLATPEPTINESAYTGGWGEVVVERDAGASCQIDVVTCVNDKEEFLRRYVDGNRPVLLRGFLHSTPECAAVTENSEMWPWPVLETWRRDKLYETHGHVTVPERRSSQIAQEYQAARGSRIVANETSLSAFMDEMQLHRNNHRRADGDTARDPPYLFEPVLLPNTRGKEYPTVLPLFDDRARYASFDDKHTRANQMFIGARNSVRCSVSCASHMSWELQDSCCIIRSLADWCRCAVHETRVWDGTSIRKHITHWSTELDTGS